MSSAAMTSGAFRRVLVALTFLLASLGGGLFDAPFGRVAYAAIAIPEYDQRCKDLAKKLTEEERDDLERRLIAYEKATGQQIAILIVPQLDGEALEDFSYRVAKAWKLGRAGKDDGVLITAAIAERRVRIEVGKGLGGDLTDVQASLIIREEMRPFTKAERWHDAFAAALSSIETKLSGKAYGPVPKKPPATEPAARRGNDVAGIFFTILLFVVIIGIILRARGGGGGGGGGGPFIFWGGGGFGGGGGGWGGGGGGGGGDWGGPSGGGGDFGGGGASDDV